MSDCVYHFSVEVCPYDGDSWIRIFDGPSTVEHARKIAQAENAKGLGVRVDADGEMIWRFAAKDPGAATR